LVTLRSLAEFLALISAHSPNLIEAGGEIPMDALQRYWDCSREQARLWIADLNHHANLADDDSAADHAAIVRRCEPLLADILAGGMTTRVWGAVLSACDQSTGIESGSLIAEGVLTQQNLVWNHLLRWLMDHPTIPVEEAARFDHLRRRVERWTDVLIGHLVHKFGVVQFAFDPDRARDFGEEQLADTWSGRDLQVWDLYLTCLRTAFPPLTLPGGRPRYLREENLRQMLASLPRDLFEDGGTFKSVWYRRLESSPSQIDQLPAALRKRLDERLSR
jgi:hypothetical protein